MFVESTEEAQTGHFEPATTLNVSFRVAVGLGGREYSLTPDELQEIIVDDDAGTHDGTHGGTNTTDRRSRSFSSMVTSTQPKPTGRLSACAPTPTSTTSAGAPTTALDVDPAMGASACAAALGASKSDPGDERPMKRRRVGEAALPGKAVSSASNASDPVKSQLTASNAVCGSSAADKSINALRSVQAPQSEDATAKIFESSFEGNEVFRPRIATDVHTTQDQMQEKKPHVTSRSLVKVLVLENQSEPRSTLSTSSRTPQIHEDEQFPLNPFSSSSILNHEMDGVEQPVDSLDASAAAIRSRVRVLSVCTERLRELIYRKVRSELDAWAATKAGKSAEENAEQLEPTDLPDVPSERFLDIALTEQQLVPGAPGVDDGPDLGVFDLESPNFGIRDDDGKHDHMAGANQCHPDNTDVVKAFPGTPIEFLQGSGSSSSSPSGRGPRISATALAHLLEERPHFVIALKPFPKIKFQKAEGDDGRPKKLVWDVTTSSAKMKTWEEYSCGLDSHHLGNHLGEPHGAISSGSPSGSTKSAAVATIHAAIHAEAQSWAFAKATADCHYLVQSWGEAILAVLEWMEWPLGGNEEDVDSKRVTDDLLRALRKFLARKQRDYPWNSCPQHYETTWLLRQDRTAGNIDVGGMRGAHCNSLTVSSSELEYILHELFTGLAISTQKNSETPGLGVSSNRHLGVQEEVLSREFTDMEEAIVDGHGGSLLHIAAAIGCQETVARILGRLRVAGRENMRHSVNWRDCNQWTPLHVAAWTGHSEVVKLLLMLGAADVSATTSHVGMSPLHHAACAGHSEIVQLLLEIGGADVNERDGAGRTPLYHAVEEGRTAVVEVLLSRDGIAVDAETGGVNGETALHVAAGGHPEILEMLLATGKVDVNKVDNYASRPVHRAAGRPRILELLLSHDDIDVNVLCGHDDGWITPLYDAARGGRLEIVELLLASGKADVNFDGSVYYGVYYGPQEHGPPLCAAVKSGHTKIVERLLAEKDVDVNATGYNNESPLYHAVDGSNFEIVELLMATGEVDVNAKWGYDSLRTPLHFAARGQNTRLVELLLSDKNIDVNAADDFNRFTPLHDASRAGYPEIVELLMATGRVNAKARSEHMGDRAFRSRSRYEYELRREGRSSQDTPLHLAAVGDTAGHTRVVELLLSIRDIDVNAKDSENRTPLMLASGRGLQNIVQALLAHEKIDVDAKNDHANFAFKAMSSVWNHLTRRTPEVETALDALDMARAGGHSEIVEMIERARGMNRATAAAYESDAATAACESDAAATAAGS